MGGTPDCDGHRTQGPRTLMSAGKSVFPTSWDFEYWCLSTSQKGQRTRCRQGFFDKSTKKVNNMVPKLTVFRNALACAPQVKYKHDNSHYLRANSLRQSTELSRTLYSRISSSCLRKKKLIGSLIFGVCWMKGVNFTSMKEKHC